ncbi:hypothetical protein Salmuc_03400 [Salipiger mucosus DSM 16094]|uniref:Uncharacterized protein n=1 Tax=Salipiger mucosus DSM 16094 TaxID=1123237 RepID=S9QEV0_9RHOB|nr:hypothetical protein Salmuc_03400 [Salipiger mucosus DSM 16094]
MRNSPPDTISGSLSTLEPCRKRLFKNFAADIQCDLKVKRSDVGKAVAALAKEGSFAATRKDRNPHPRQGRLHR